MLIYLIMKKNLQALLFVLFSVTSFSQTTDSANRLITDTTYFNKDTINQNRNFTKNKISYSFSAKEYPYNTKRVTLVAAGNIAGYGGAMAALYKTWYSHYPQTHFHTFDDNREWKQMDKFGHIYSAYIESYGSMEMWRWAGLPRKQRIIIGGMSGAAYQTIIEVLDGFSAQWGWSWGDFGANVVGSSVLVSQELAWNEQRIRYKFSFHRKNYGNEQLNQRANTIYGNSTLERMLKDYNGQTYWLSANLKSFLPQSNLPAWLNIAAGYGAEGMFGARANLAQDEHGNVILDRRDIKRYRQFYIAPDIDLSKIRTKSKLVRLAFGVLNSFKFPAPSLEFSNHNLKLNWVHF